MLGIDTSWLLSSFPNVPVEGRLSLGGTPDGQMGQFCLLICEQTPRDKYKQTCTGVSGLLEARLGGRGCTHSWTGAPVLWKFTSTM